MAYGLTKRKISIEGQLKNKDHKECSKIKSQEIVKLHKPLKVRRSKYELEITRVQQIEGGVEVFARAWNSKGQIGFGKDGTVDIERFRIFNPPVLVDDHNGDIVRESTDPETGEVKQRRLREDPHEAILQEIEHTISVKVQKYGPENIVLGKIGNTTSTFYPDAGDPGTTSIDGSYDETQGSGKWDAVHDETSSNSAVGTDTNEVYCRARVGGETSIIRSIFLFDTSTIDSADIITSATFSLRGTAKFTGVNDGNDFVSVVQSNPASNTTMSTADYDQVGDAVDNPTEGVDSGDRIDITTWSTSGYNDFPLNSTGLGWIDEAGITKLGVREGHDIVDSAPASGTTGVRGYYADRSGTSNDPKLVVEHGVASTFTPKVMLI